VNSEKAFSWKMALGVNHSTWHELFPVKKDTLAISVTLLGDCALG